MASIDDVVGCLRLVIDPELGVNVVDLGLVYGIVLEPDAVRVQLAMTSPTCPLSGYLVDSAIRTIAHRIPGIGRIFVALTDEPVWRPEMMSDDARALLD